jgi:hypothetical protein
MAIPRTTPVCLERTPKEAALKGRVVANQNHTAAMEAGTMACDLPPCPLTHLLHRKPEKREVKQICSQCVILPDFIDLPFYPA